MVEEWTRRPEHAGQVRPNAVELSRGSIYTGAACERQRELRLGGHAEAGPRMEAGMLARDIMTSPVVTTTEDATVAEAAALMVEHGTSCLPVLNRDGQLTGIITHSDFGFHRKFLPMADHLYTLMGSFVRPETVEMVAREVSARRIGDVMSQPVVTLEEDAPVAKVADLMISKGIHRLPVTRGNELVGIITRHDLVKLMTQSLAGS